MNYHNLFFLIIISFFICSYVFITNIKVQSKEKKMYRIKISNDQVNVNSFLGDIILYII